VPGPDTPEEVAALAVLEESVALLVNLLGWGVALGIGIIWAHTFSPLFQGIARALTFTINTHFHYRKTFHLGGWASSLDHAATEAFTTWAKDQEQAVGMWWYAIGWTVNQLVVQTKELAATTARFAHWTVHSAIPGAIDTAIRPWSNKTNKAAATAGAAGALALLLKKALRAEHRAEHAANQATRAATRAAGHEAHVAKSVATTTAGAVTHETKVITQVIDVASLPVPFGRTVAQIKKRIGLLEAGVGATAVAVALANVLGIPNPKCLTRGPIGRVARTLCGMPSHFLNDLLGLLADFLILENVCIVLPWVEAAAAEVAVPLVEALTVVGAGLCKGSIGVAQPLQGPMPSVPAVTYSLSLAA
jgi:hypothetical protein